MRLRDPEMRLLLYRLMGSEVTYRSQQDCEIRAAKLAHKRKVNSYDLALVIEKRAARSARSSLSIIDNLVRQYVADVPLEW